jgi:hypothetical protein
MIHPKVVLKTVQHYKHKYFKDQMDIIKINSNSCQNQVVSERIDIQTKWKIDYCKVDSYNKDKPCKITIIKSIRMLLYLHNNRISNYLHNLCKMHKLP